MRFHFIEYVHKGDISENTYKKCKEAKGKGRKLDAVRCTFRQHAKYYWLVKVCEIIV